MTTYGANQYACYSEQYGYQDLGPYTTYLIWQAYDGTETILTDAPTNGAPQGANATCQQVQNQQTPNRGRTFHSKDGSNLLFIAGHDIIDGNYSNVTDGTLILADGTRYSFSLDGYVSKIEDRNGNLITFTFQATADGGIYNITDPLNRTPSINFTESLASDTQDILTYPGLSGNNREIKVNYALLQNALSAGESPQTYHSLFPELNGASSITQFNPYVISSVVLKDGTSYTMQYNVYGEVKRLQLPTGGVYIYQYPANSGVLALDNNSGYRIYRRLQERDEYADGSNLSAKIVFPVPNRGHDDSAHSNRPTTSVEVDFEDSSNTVLRKEMHSFYGDPGSTQPPPTDPTTYANWWEGLEYKTEVRKADNTAVQRLEQMWMQRPCGNGETCAVDPQNESSPAHDPQLLSVTTTMDSVVKKTEYTYNEYNDVTEQKDYAWGTGSPGGLIRDTQTSFLQYLPQNILSLPSEVKVFNGSGGLAGDTKYRYDEYGNPATPLYNCPDVVGHDNQNFTGGGPRGNLTTISRWLNQTNSWLNTYQAYDIAGNLITVTDANNHTTSFSYNDNYPQGNRNTYAQVTVVSNALGQTSFQAQYDYSTGQRSVMADLNGHYTFYSYTGLGYGLDQLAQVDYPNGGHTYYTYPSPTQVVTYRDQTAAVDKALASETQYDGLGRLKESDTFEDSSQYIATTWSYDALGRVAKVTNPSRYGGPGSGPGFGVGYPTTYIYDALGRVTTAQTTDGAATTTSYSGNQDDCDRCGNPCADDHAGCAGPDAICE